MIIPTNPNISHSFDAVNTSAKATNGIASKPTDSIEDQKLKKAAGDFESILLASMWKGMKNSFGSSDSDSTDPAHGTLEDWGIEIMSGAVGKAGGLGIGKLILNNLEPTLHTHGAQGVDPALPQISGSRDDKTK